MKSIKRKLFNLLPKNNVQLYRFCKTYVDRFNNDNDDNIFTNGEFRFMQNNLKNCQVVFDVGANVGEWAKLALTINPKIWLHCFEPANGAFQRLVSSGFPPSVVCNNLGVGQKPEDKELFIFDDGSGTNSLYQRWGLEDGWGIKPQQRTEVIKLITLDDYCQDNNIEKIDFLKIDVEGHELCALKGADNLLREEKIKIIQFEYGGCFIDARIFLKDIFEYIGNFNYSIFKILPDNLRLIGRYDQRLESFQYSNYAVILNGYHY